MFGLNIPRLLSTALPKMVKAASSEELQSAFEEHLEVTKKQVQRLDQAFQMLNKTPKRKKCKGMEGLLEEGKEKMEEDAEPEVLDASLIVGAQKVEHYEIAGYGSARTFAHVLGKSKVAALLQQSLAEEADKKPTCRSAARDCPPGSLPHRSGRP